MNGNTSGSHPLRGGIYSALPSPMDASGALDHGSLARLLEGLISRGVEGFYACGSTGECFLLEDGERMEILEEILGIASGRVPVIAHVGSMSTSRAEALARHAAAHGASAVSATPPFYFNYGLEEVRRYYADIVQASGLPLLVYNIPAFSGRNLGLEGLDALLRIPGVAGLKHTSMNLHELERARNLHPDKLFFSGYDEIYLGALAMGSDGMIGSTVNLMPELFLRIRAAFLSGDVANASTTQHLVNSVIGAIAAAPFFPSLKRALAFAGYPCGDCRKPFLPLAAEQEKALEAALADLGMTGSRT